MSNSTAGIYDAIGVGQLSKEVTANAYFDAVSPANLGGRRASLCSGLVWGWYGGTLQVDGGGTQIYLSSSNQFTCTASTTYYFEFTRAGVANFATGSFTPGNIPLYVIVAGTTSITSYTDYRAWAQPKNQTSKNLSGITSTGGTITLTEPQANCRYIKINGALGSNLSVVVPNDWEGIVYCANTGAFTTTIKTSGGAGIMVAQTKRALLFADGTDVVRVTADV